MKKEVIIRIQRIAIENFKNTESGEIRFPCNFERDICAPKADILGIYGQNGSGKTTFIEALELLKNLLCGQEVGEYLPECIFYGQERAELQCEFSILGLDGEKELYRRRFIYSAVLSKDTIDETARCVSFHDGQEKTVRLKTIFETFHHPESEEFTPQIKLESLFGSRKSMDRDRLRVIKLLCQREHRSFLFSPEFLEMLRETEQKYDDGIDPLFEIAHFAETSLFVIRDHNGGMSCLNIVIPTETPGGMPAIPIEQPVTVPDRFLGLIRQAVSMVSAVLCKMVPGTNLALAEHGTELIEDGEQGTKIQLVRELLCADGKMRQIPLKDDSDGIRKLVSILHLLIAAYNNPSVTLAVDDLDSGISEYLLGELLRIMQNSGKGQLVFSAHNLYPLETLQSRSVVFTTTDAADRYTQIGSVRSTNNLRSMYLREIALGSNLYREISMPEITHAMRSVHRQTENDTSQL